MKITWTIAIILGWILLIGPGSIDGRFNPVVTPAEITDIQLDPQDSRWVIISGSSTKLRATCYPRRLDWYKGERGGEDVSIEWDWRAPAWREDGLFEFSEWRVRAVPAEIMRDKTFADIIHQCRLFGIDYPWLTRSRFWN
ncbi:hypothetical protein [Sulfitobacter guttiformis]|uniref:Uncharacterized protein n=1 Tax=Sulfitobacter guttiformis TaxID=74349 RepID=A0A420DHB7_9RHOB|nr:hypothetical protein [Sulfitobacter guttiformis]KIN72654.1 hypothetical protein Z949_1832 [Sulfitobacter guttiformis KCTC 32187]RKE93616.1 hypothetical protein C8N30_2693 [Sulfitobacter guttiformis]